MFDPISDSCPNMDSAIDREDVLRLSSAGKETLDDPARIF